MPSQPSDVICTRDLRWSSLARTHTISYHTHPNTVKRTGLVAKIHLLYAQQKVTMMRGQAQKMSNEIRILNNILLQDNSSTVHFSSDHFLQFQHEDMSLDSLPRHRLTSPIMMTLRRAMVVMPDLYPGVLLQPGKELLLRTHPGHPQLPPLG